MSHGEQQEGRLIPIDVQADSQSSASGLQLQPRRLKQVLGTAIAAVFIGMVLSVSDGDLIVTLSLVKSNSNKFILAIYITKVRCI